MERLDFHDLTVLKENGVVRPPNLSMRNFSKFPLEKLIPLLDSNLPAPDFSARISP